MPITVDICRGLAYYNGTIINRHSGVVRFRKRNMFMVKIDGLCRKEKYEVLF